MSQRTFNRIIWALIFCMLIPTACMTGRSTAMLKDAAQSYLERYRDVAERIASAREDLAGLEKRDPDGLRAFDTVAADANAKLAACNRIAQSIVDQSIFTLGPTLLVTRSRKVQEFTDAHDRLHESLKTLDSLKDDLSAELQEQTEGMCYCSCTNPGGGLSKKGRRTMRQCDDLCRDEHYAQATCM